MEIYNEKTIAVIVYAIYELADKVFISESQGMQYILKKKNIEEITIKEFVIIIQLISYLAHSEFENNTDLQTCIDEKLADFTYGVIGSQGKWSIDFSKYQDYYKYNIIEYISVYNTAINEKNDPKLEESKRFLHELFDDEKIDAQDIYCVYNLITEYKERLHNFINNELKKI